MIEQLTQLHPAIYATVYIVLGVLVSKQMVITFPKAKEDMKRETGLLIFILMFWPMALAIICFEHIKRWVTK